MTDEIKADSEFISNGIYIEIIDIDHVSIICNLCTKTRVVFASGLPYLFDDWLREATIHLTKFHPRGKVIAK